MNDQPAPSEQPQPAEDRPVSASDIDLEALTKAVERLWRHDLALERERLNGVTSPDQRW